MSTCNVRHGMRTRQCWRITKYDPRFRDKSGRYLRDEWIGAAQIGEAFAGEVLTKEEYLRVEGLYAAAVLRLWNAAGARSLQIQALELGPSGFGLPPQSDALRDVGFGDWRPVNGEPVPAACLEAMVRWCLRGLGWCQLGADEFRVRWGHDFYMYVEAVDAKSADREAIASTGLFVEPEDFQIATPIRGFRVLVSRIDSSIVDDEAVLPALDADAIADLWPPLPALVGYVQRAIDPALAARIRRYSDLTFDFDRYTYILGIDD